MRRAVDPYSTAYVFEGWAERQTPFIRWDRSLLPVSYPTTWLLTTGWKRGGGLLSIHEVPG